MPDSSPAGPHRLLAGLNAAQRAAVASDAGVLCVVAGAGAGKTTVLTRRVAWRVLAGDADPEHAVVVTFTRKAATELRTRLARLGVPEDIRAATFHSAAYAQLRQYWADNGVRPPSLLRDPVPFLARILQRHGSPASGRNQRGPGPSATVVGALANELSWARARLVTPEEYPEAAARAGRRPPASLDAVADLCRRYEVEKRRRGVLDLDDLVLHCADAMTSDPSWAAAVRWRLRHLFVDEFQDVNPAQWRLLEAWRHGREDLCVVGDPRQAVYGWNGSDPTLIERFGALIPNTTVLHLDANHRSTPQIVRAAAAVLAGADSGALPTATRDDGPVPRLAGFDQPGQEATALARWIRMSRRPGRRWDELAVLARTHARLTPVAEALEHAGIPFHRVAAPSPNPTRSSILKALRCMDPRMALGAGLVDALADTDEDDDEAVRLVDALAGEHLAEEPGATVGSFLAWLVANQGELEIPGRRPDAVALATFHQAKGLEWRTVALVGLEEGTMPIAYAVTEEAMAEERRLLYVALTRAERDLWCSWAGPGRRSPWLASLEDAVERNRPLPAPAAAGRVAALRRRLASVG